ncbi:hypothetical protein BDSB_10405 [Burkholderia dolosa PC543]|nr:hypothetical protein BDSB_10405 [Burkholderia dolosa PC543]
MAGQVVSFWEAAKADGASSRMHARGARPVAHIAVRS